MLVSKYKWHLQEIIEHFLLCKVLMKVEVLLDEALNLNL